MLAFTLKRLGVALLVALTVSLITFSMIYVSGDPAIAIAGEGARAAGHRGDPQVLRLRPADRGAVSRLAGRRGARRLRPLLHAAPAGRRRDLRPPAGHHDPRRVGDRLRAAARHSPRRAGRGASQQPLRPLRPDARRRRPGDAELLVRAHLDPVARRHLAAAADHRLGQLAELRDAGDRARLLRDARRDAAHARRRAGGAVLRLHPHRARQGPAAR